LAGAFEGTGATALGSGDEVVAVVRAHRMSLSRNMFGCLMQRTGSRGGRLRGDDGEQVGFDGAVHLGQAGVAVGLGAGDQRAGSSSCLRCWGRNSAVVTNSGQVRHALACGHDFCSGRPQ
jgi:hypothetical protein